MKLSVVIPTYNHAGIWRRRALVRTLLHQTVSPDEILVCDDNSADDTLKELQIVRKELPLRLFRCNAKKITSHHDSALPDNILYKEASGDMLLHMDADGYVHPRLVEFVKLLDQQAAYYGGNIFIDPPTHRVIGLDARYDMLAVKPDEAVALEAGACQGALYAVPREVVLDSGGHDMDFIGYRGCDNRLGARLHLRLQSWFVGLPHMRFYHFGLSTYRQLKASGKEFTYEQWKLPDLKTTPFEANGGRRFWESGLEGLYEEVG